MLRKILLIIMSVFCIAVMGCGGGGESGKESSKPKEAAYKTEARNFDKVYGEGFLRTKAEVYKEFIPLLKKYGSTPRAYDEFIKFDNVGKYAAFKEKLAAAKIEHAEVQPLKELLVNVADAEIAFMKFLETRDYSDSTGQAEGIVKKMAQTKFAYKNNFSLIVEGKPLPVVNSSTGQLYAYEASNVLFGIEKIRESKELGGSVLSEKANGKFIIVTVAVFNNQKDAITIDFSRFKLIDKEGREYSSSTRGMIGLEMESRRSNSLLEQLNPNMGMESTIVFDMPPNVDASEYEMVTSGGFTGAEVKIPLRDGHNGY